MRRLALGAVMALIPWSSAATAQQAQPAPVVLFVLDTAEAAPDDAELTNALLAQFTLLDVELRFERTALEGLTLAERIAHARALAESAGALAVFWIDATGESEWLLHMMDVSGPRVLIRPVTAAATHEAAATEVVAVMTRESAQALLATAPPESAPPPASELGPSAPPAAAPPPPPVTAAAAPSRLTLSLGYAGATFSFSPDLLSHSAALGVFYALDPDLRFHAGFATSVSVPMERETTRLTFGVTRVPFLALAGYRLLRQRVPLDVLLGFGRELLYQTQGEPENLPSERVQASGEQIDWLWIASARVRAELPTQAPVGLHLSLGVDALISDFSYVAIDVENATRRPLLEPSRVRLVGELGLTFHL